MSLIVHHPFSGLLGFLFPRSTREVISQPQPESQALQLSQMIQQQKRINDLVWVCEKDRDGKLDCQWVKENLL